jgi:AcrR family transcriptional regulator
MALSKKQQTIIEDAIEIIADLGIQGFTIKNLSQKLGVTEGAIYRHFKSKLEILHTILAVFQDECRNVLENVCLEEKSAFENIAAIFNHHFEYFAKKPAVAAVIFSESIFQNDNLLSREVYELLRMHEIGLMKIIESGQRKGELVNGSIKKEQIVRMIIGSIRYTVTQWRLDGYSFDIRKEGNKLLNNIRELIVT